MSRRSYPFAEASMQRKWAKLTPKAAPKCVACGAPATHRVTIQVSWFRGDDECGRACALHKNDAQAVLDGIERVRVEQQAHREAAAAKAAGRAPC